ncbi:MAG: c-type cytochrome [Deltaproteobacteria bacterium]|nr:c-type cytochrome [Deltaproteobacteria bacterium]
MIIRAISSFALAATLVACGGKKPTPPSADVAPATTTSAPPTTAAPTEPPPTTAPTEPPPTTAAPTSAEADAGSAPTPTADPALIERGKLIANVAGCALCHTAFGPNGPDMANMWAGGLEIPEEFGTWRSPNITQDKKTGIGGWTDEQIDAAVRQGLRPDGSRLYPIMPYQFYNAMSDADAKALVAFLRTIAPIEKAVAGNTDLQMPKAEVPKPAGAAPEDTPIKRGEYYGTLMHCAACHTPMGEQGPDMSKMYAGGMKMEMPAFFEGTLYLPNITSDKKTGIGDYTDEQILAVLTKGQKKDGSPMIGPMAMYAPQWAQLPEGDLKDIVAWVRSIPPIENAVPASTAKMKGPPPGEAPPGDAPKGETPPGEAPKGETPPGEAPKGETPPGEAPKGETPPGEAPTPK